MQGILLPFTLLVTMLFAGFGPGGDDDTPASGSLKLDVHPAAFVDAFDLSFELVEADSLILGAYDATNRQVLRLNLGSLEAGKYVFEIDGSRWAAGPHVVIVTGHSGLTGSTGVIKIGKPGANRGSSIAPPLVP